MTQEEVENHSLQQIVDGSENRPVGATTAQSNELTNPLEVVENQDEQVIDTTNHNNEEPTPVVTQCSYVFTDTTKNSSLKEALGKLKEFMDKALELKQSQKLNELDTFYHETMIPYLIELRKLNRFQQTSLDSELKKLRQFNQRILESQMNRDCFLFEASRLEAESAGIRNSYSAGDICKGSPSNEHTLIICAEKNDEKMQEEHLIRMKQLDDERERRKDLWKKLACVQEETTDVEQKSNKCEEQLQTVKPLMNKLVATVHSTIKKDQVATTNAV